MPSRKKDFNLPVFKNETELIGFLEDSFTESLKQLIRMTVKLMIKEEMKGFREDNTRGLVTIRADFLSIF